MRKSMRKSISSYSKKLAMPFLFLAHKKPISKKGSKKD